MWSGSARSTRPAPTPRRAEPLSLRDLLGDALARAAEVERLLSNPDTFGDSRQVAELGREHRRLQPVLELAARLQKAENELADARELVSVDDPEMAAEAAREVERLESSISDLEAQLKPALLPHDPLDDRNAIVEIRAGTGGDEAALFAADLFRMYSRFIERHGWRREMISLSEGTLGGIKEAVFKVSGDGAFGAMRHESGVHRVQRVPATETQGRIHTSAATVAVLPEVEDVDVEINDSDLKIDTMRAQGAGGQHVNKTESAIRITHMPSGIVVYVQEERSQHKNRAKAMKMLRAKLYDQQRTKLDAERAADRRGQVGSGDRSERIRTYNFPQGRVTDHRINLTLYKLPQVMEGEALDEVIDALVTQHQADLLAAEGVQ